MIRLVEQFDGEDFKTWVAVVPAEVVIVVAVAAAVDSVADSPANVWVKPCKQETN
jgi:hypothetical protein